MQESSRHRMLERQPLRGSARGAEGMALMSDPSFDQDVAHLRDECRRLRDDLRHRMEESHRLLRHLDDLVRWADELVRRQAALAGRAAAGSAAGSTIENADAASASPAEALSSGPLPAFASSIDDRSVPLAQAGDRGPVTPADQPLSPPAECRPAGKRSPLLAEAVFIPRAPGAEAGSAPAAEDPLKRLADRLRQAFPSSSARPASRRGGASVELAIGGTWLNRIGAVVLFLAVAFFAKYSFDQGWISPTARVIAAGVVGLALVGLGEWFVKGPSRTFAGGLLGCGVGVLYLAVFAAHGFYGLISHAAAFGLYVSVTALSIAVAVHGRHLPIAVLALIGGFATPILVSTGDNRQVELLVYLLALDVAFCVCADARRWDILRGLSWVGTTLLFGGWALKFYSEAVAWRTAAFVVAFYVLFHGEAIVALRRAAVEHPRWLAQLLRVNNAAFFASVYFLLRHVAAGWMGLFAIAAAAVQWTTAWKLLPRGRSAAHPRLNLWIDGAAMLALAAPMQFDRYMVSVSWAVQSVVALYFCRRFGSTWLRIKAVGVWIAAAGHLLIYEYRDEALAAALVRGPLWHVSWMLVLFVAVGLLAYAGAAAALLRRTPHPDDKLAATFLLLAGTALLLGIFAAQWDRYVAAFAWMVLGALWWALARRSAGAQAMALLVLAAATAKFLLWDTAAAAASGGWRELAGPGTNRAVLCGIALTALACLNRAVLVRRPGNGDRLIHRYPVGSLLTVAALALITWTGTFETARAIRFEPWVQGLFEKESSTRGLFVTAFWGLNALALWPFARAARPALTGFALVLTWLAVLRYLLGDTLVSSIGGRWSELSGIGSNRTFVVGLLLIGVSFYAYGRTRAIQRGGATRWLSLRAVQAILALGIVAAAWAPTFEIGRVFRFEPFRDRFADASLAMHVVLSAFWSLYATALLVVGFSRRTSLVRRAGLVFFALTILKVAAVDVSYLERVYRIISFAVLGVLLLFASWLYHRLSARVLERPEVERTVATGAAASA